ncbi:MAG: hypothetical protein KJ583_00425 [Nanoarchaeota archaeon]|nr:hypothetical protein [Nanoarchaeota archaeon]MBU1269308.1 hypothetical protein [Nanoarchaeota archaeon]MBU1603754.1 hypothetical protein [Nanoarchaeota archaeon]MBU2443880.1 hypothetical protein [Nanoarchaeota archaeon]
MTKFIKDFTKEFEIEIVKCRRIGHQETFYVPTIHAVNFFSGQFVFPMRYVDDKGKVGLAFYFKRPLDYFYRPYKYYKLPRKYTVSGGISKTTHSFYVPIPAMLMADVGVSRKAPNRYLHVKGGFLQDGTKVLLVTKSTETCSV